MYIKFFILLTLSVTLAQTEPPKDLEGNPTDASVVTTNTTQPTTSTTFSTTTTSTIATTAESVLPIDPQRECEQDVETTYVYTPCDAQGNRWKVQVPRQPGVCRITNPVAPAAGVKCTFTCEAGEFLNINTQKCAKCPPGTVSVGDSKLYSNFRKLPEEFETYGHAVSKKEFCKKAGWQVKDGFLESNGSSCRSVLKYTVELAKAGNITFTAKSGAVSSFFHAWVESGTTCSSSYDASTLSSDKNTEMYYTLSNEWQTFSSDALRDLVPFVQFKKREKHRWRSIIFSKLDLDKGHNVVNFVAAYFSSFFFSTSSKDSSSFESNSQRSVLIKDFVVRGFAYSPACKRCEAGWYSPGGMSECSPCPENTYSLAGSSACIACGPKQYSSQHAEKCEDRKPCIGDDFQEYWEPCENTKTRKRYRWKEPKICNEESGVKLPEFEDEVDCPPCNPGLFNNGSKCEFCPSGTFSDGTTGCQKCPPETAPAPGLFYKFWTQMPNPPMRLYCIARPQSGCHSSKGWEVKDSHIASGSGHSDDAELLMYIKVHRFTRKKSQFSMDFEIEFCNGMNCRLKIQLIDANHVVHDIAMYEGNTERTTENYTHYSDTGIEYRILFEKKYDEHVQTFHHQVAQVKIYSIEVSDVEGGGTEKCVPCATQGSGNCVKCDPGSFINNNKACQKCPANTYLPEEMTDSLGEKSCKKCPKETVSEAGSTECHSDCIFTVNDRNRLREYNLTALGGPHFIKGPPLFTSKGYKFFHGFTVSMCGHPYHKAECIDNATTRKSDKHILHAAICRSTFIPDEDKVLSTQSIRVTEICKNGTTGMIRLLCDPSAEGKGEISFGNGTCTTETCDGCNYYFTWKSTHACAKCTADDYEKLTTTCKDEKKQIKYIWNEPRKCVGGVTKPEDETVECSIFDRNILDFKLVIMGFLVGAVLLAAVVIWLCYRNRSLSYKYHRLIDASQMKDGELPPSEKCALEDDEEEEDEVILARSNGKTRFLDRLRGMKKKKKDTFSEFETINLDATKGISLDDEDDDEL